MGLVALNCVHLFDAALGVAIRLYNPCTASCRLVGISLKVLTPLEYQPLPSSPAVLYITEE